MGLYTELETKNITNVTRRWHFSYRDIHPRMSIAHIFSTTMSPVCQARVDALECLDARHYPVAARLRLYHHLRGIRHGNPSRQPPARGPRSCGHHHYH